MLVNADVFIPCSWYNYSLPKYIYEIKNVFSVNSDVYL